ncbi:MAG: hypothetical protein AB1349_12930 [Elusimicrobiota bacterium]
MAYVNTLKVFEILRDSFDEKQSKRISESIEVALETNNAELLKTVATKMDLKNTEVKIIKWLVILWLTQMVATLGILLK